MRGMVILAGLVMVLQVGCACTGAASYPLSCDQQFERGEPNDLVDVTGNVLSIPSKILLWNRRIDNHCISAQTEDTIRDYVTDNGLSTTKVRFNQYDPLGEWKRLGRNKTVPPLMRYTFGTVQTLGYTVLPGRLFGGDKYNPYTDSLSVYSDVPSVGMAEVAYAKDLQSREHPGWYAFGQEFPILGMLHEGRATQDVLQYVAVHGDPELQKEGYEILYPRYGAAWGTTIGDLFTPVTPAGTIAGSIVGHVAGRKRSREIATIGYEAPMSPYETLPNTSNLPSEPAITIPSVRGQNVSPPGNVERPASAVQGSRKWPR